MDNGALFNRPFAVTLVLVVLIGVSVGWLFDSLSSSDEDLALAEGALPVATLEFAHLVPLDAQQPKVSLCAGLLELKPAGIPGVESVKTEDSSPAPESSEGGEASAAVPVKVHEVGSYQVRAGDSLYWIAKTYGVSVTELRELNGLEDNAIRPGQALQVPMDSLRNYPVGVSLTEQEVDWIARMVHAEARGEPYLGQVAVASVIINRLASRAFPNTIREVLYQPNAFQPIRNGSFERPANDMARRAVSEALQGHDPTKGALYFFNPRLSSDRFMHSRPKALTIGEHRFMY